MAAFNFHRRKTRRWWYVGVTLVAAAALSVFFVGGASANLGASSFEGNDGNLVVDTSGDTDWCTDFPAPAATATCTTPITDLHTGIDLASGKTDNSFGQGTKEDSANVTVVKGSIPPNKSDLTRFYEASELIGSDVYLYLAWERTNNLGNANMDFEINQDSTSCPGTAAGACTINRTNGDVLVTYDFSGSGTPTLGILRWLVAGEQNPDQTNHPGVNTASECFSSNTLPCWGDHETLNSTNSEGQVDTGASGTVDPIAPNAPRTIVQNGFGEAAINLTGAGVITQSNGCNFGQATTFLKSRSSSSFTSEVKDFIAPVSTPVFENCGALKITKVSSKSATTTLAGATFNICTNAGPYSTNNPCTAPTGITNPVSTGTDGTYCASGLTPGNYYVTEVGAPTGYGIADTTTHTVNVATGTCASPGANDSLTFTDPPLTDVTLDVSSEASGGTNSAVSCVDSGNADIGNSPQPDGVDLNDTSTYGDPVGFSATGLTPGTYTCTVIIDP